MANFRCLIFQSSKLVSSKEYENQWIAETAGRIALRWQDCDRVEIWNDHAKVEAWVREDEKIQAPL